MLLKAEAPGAIEKAVEALSAGGLVAMPTETVYGLAADAVNDHAVARIFEAKGRPRFNPLIAHVSGIEMAQRLVETSSLALHLCETFWPGPLTLVLPRRSDADISLLASAGNDTLAVRAPRHPIASKLIKDLGRPLVAPSANRSGMISPTTAAAVEANLGDRVDIILDGGRCAVGVESTIVKVMDDRLVLLRPGGLAREAIANAAGMPVEDHEAVQSGLAPLEAPGMMTSHYAPNTPLRTDVHKPLKSEAYLAFGEAAFTPSGVVMNLSADRDLTQAAANLFAFMRELDHRCAKESLSGIAVAPIPDHGLGEAINDRLRRAAAPR